MKGSNMLKDTWRRLPIEKKVRTFASAVLIMLMITAVFSLAVTHFSISDYGGILASNEAVQKTIDDLAAEEEKFRAFISERTDSNLDALHAAEEHTMTSIEALPDDYTVIGSERFARTWRIRNAYGSYCKLRDEVVEARNSDQSFIKKLYQVYSIQDYLDAYARRLLQKTVSDGSRRYLSKLPVFRSIPFILLNLCLLLAFVLFSLSQMMSESIVRPVKALSKEAREITENHFDTPDVKVENEDEIGELAETFNLMKASTGNYIATLKDNHRMTELLQKQELERIEMEKRLDANRLELMKSQINPHFLFNTLNMIGSMAELEDASTTERMIRALSSLFRYNLNTRDQVVPLQNEMKAAENYIYLQKMRFGSRIGYEEIVPDDRASLFIPSFTLQPLIENSLVHGIGHREEGGKVSLVVRHDEGFLVIRVEDNGVGIEPDRLDALRKQMDGRATGKIGIGLGNICKRVHLLYEGSTFTIDSQVGRGTAVVIRIPEKYTVSGGLPAQNEKEYTGGK